MIKLSFLLSAALLLSPCAAVKMEEFKVILRYITLQANQGQEAERGLPLGSQGLQSEWAMH